MAGNCMSTFRVESNFSSYLTKKEHLSFVISAYVLVQYISARIVSSVRYVKTATTP